MGGRQSAPAPATAQGVYPNCTGTRGTSNNPWFVCPNGEQACCVLFTPNVNGKLLNNNVEKFTNEIRSNNIEKFTNERFTSEKCGINKKQKFLTVTN
jgi:hypothetical protein